LNFFSIGTSSTFVEEENRTNSGKMSPEVGNQNLPANSWHFSTARGEEFTKKGRVSIRLEALNQESLSAAKMDNPESVTRSDFVFHAVQMVLYRLFRQAELISDFLVGQPLCDQRNDLLFAPRQA
jgi:hypothetical protein